MNLPSPQQRKNHLYVLPVFTLALSYTGASRVTFLLYTSPFWAPVLLPIFVRSERLNRVQWLGLACTFAAVVFALLEG